MSAGNFELLVDPLEPLGRTEAGGLCLRCLPGQSIAGRIKTAAMKALVDAGELLEQDPPTGGQCQGRRRELFRHQGRAGRAASADSGHPRWACDQPSEERSVALTESLADLVRLISAMVRAVHLTDLGQKVAVAGRAWTLRPT